MSSSSKPSQYPLLGFKDRHLEDDYLEYLVVASRARIILGYVTVILLYGLGPFYCIGRIIRKAFGYKTCTGLGLTSRRKTSKKTNKRESGPNTFQRLQARCMPFFVSCFSCSFLVGGRVLALDSIDSF